VAEQMTSVRPIEFDVLIDEAGGDDKLICVPARDPRLADA
jgi:inorganic pyrophosphatase